MPSTLTAMKFSNFSLSDFGVSATSLREAAPTTTLSTSQSSCRTLLAVAGRLARAELRILPLPPA